MSSRRLKSRATTELAVAPLTCTDRTAPVVFGLEPRAFREFVARERIAHARLGQRVIARVVDVLAALDRLRVTDGEEPIASALDDEEQPETAAAVLRALGMELARAEPK